MIWSYHCLNIVIVKESKIGQCVFLHFDMNRTGLTSTLTCQRPFLRIIFPPKVYQSHFISCISKELW